MTWEISVTGPIRISGEGPLPTLVHGGTPTAPPPIPLPPPVPPPPADDGRPYDWPAGGPNRPAYDYERYTWSWLIPGRAEDDPIGRMYAFVDSAGWPSMNHKNAGIITQGPQAGRRLWAPWDTPPALIRRVMAGLL